MLCLKLKKDKLSRLNQPKVFDSKESASIFLEKNTNATYKLSSLNKNQLKSPAPPFTTSTLQQEASRKLYFSVSKTMNMAQRLYEAGLITYMRTDSVNLSDEASESQHQRKLILHSAKITVHQEILKENLKVRKKLMKLFALQILHYIQLMLIVIKQGFMN